MSNAAGRTQFAAATGAAVMAASGSGHFLDLPKE